MLEFHCFSHDVLHCFPQQIAYGELTRWANEHSSDECRATAQANEKFRNFMQSHLRHEMRHEIGDAVDAVGTVKKSLPATTEIQQFVFDYTKEPSENLKPKSGFVLLAGKPMAYAEFKRKLDEAIATGLIF